MGDQVLQATKRTGQSQPFAPRVRLTCEACRQRKVKCDKLSPCTSCQRLGLVCVPVERARLPRGRTQKTAERALSSDNELSDRVTKLEQLLQKLATERGSDSSQAPIVAGQQCYIVEQVSDAEAKKADVDTWRDRVALSNPSLSHGPRRSKAYMGSSFWEDIMQQDIKDPPGFGFSLVSSESPKSLSTAPQSNKGLTRQPQLRQKLCDIYLKNVDPLFKILHRPSLRAFLWDGKPYLDYEPDDQVPATLASAVYLTAVCSLDEAECQMLFNIEKAAVVAEFQKETEEALARADFVTTNDLTVLQAYVLSLLAARSQDQSRRVWTMLSMALRVGQALSLHIADPPFAVCPFEQEMRRRVWLGIGLLDVAASLDRASEPMMQSAWLDSHPPLNINDEDIWLGMQGPIREHPEGTFTDMTHILVTAASSSATRSLAFTDFIEAAVKLMGLRQQAVLDFQQTASNLLSGCRPDLSDFQWYAQKTAGVISSWLQLACLRPLQRSKNFIPPKLHGYVLLKLAANNLQWSEETYNYPGAAPWRWFGSMWVPWHALAVAIAELCVCKDPTVMSRYWSVVDQVYRRSRFVIADSQHGMLWKPLERIMAQAETRRQELLGPDLTSQFLSQFPFNDLSTELIPQQHESQHVPSVPLDLGATTNRQTNPSLTEPPPFEPMPWPNVWDAMDMSCTDLEGPIDTGWLSYESFIENVYESVDFMFLPR